MNILVTGAGSLVGHGILRSLRLIKNKKLRIVTADPDHRAAGHWLGDYGVKIPLAKSLDYISALNDVVVSNDIDVTFIGTDPELLKISSACDEIKCTVVVSKTNAIKIGDDKWETVQFLRSNGLAYADSCLLNDDEEVKKLINRVGFPLIAKPRVGARSVGVFRIETESDLLKLNKDPGYVLQEFLPEGEGEFTAGTMTFDGKCFSCVIFKRDLKDGNTYRAYSYQNDLHENFLRTVSEKMEGVFGPLNFQYRLKENVPVVFEINSRFSGTTPLRTAVGVNEIEMVLQYIETGAVLQQRPILQDVAILRTWSDIIVPMRQFEEFGRSQVLRNPSATSFPFLETDHGQS
jgi:carbamoyl-phosphate synthase large subunit